MDRYVGIVGESAVWRRGVLSVLSDTGIESVEYGSISEVDQLVSLHALVVECGTVDPAQLADFVVERPGVPVIAYVDSTEVEVAARALRAGASAVIDSESSTDLITTSVIAAISGMAAIRLSIARAMAHFVPDTGDIERWISSEERQWIRAMASGLTVADIAVEAGYSERAMFRSLRTLYQKIGVANRTEALLWASRMGILGED